MAYTTIDDPSAHFQAALYSSTGNGANITVTNDGNSDLQPDWLWIKVRNGTTNHDTFDSSRGITSKRLFPNLTNAEDSNGIASVTSDGFTTGTSIGNINNTSGANNYVAWQWKANGGTTTTNDASSTGVGNTDSVYQANTTAGFSIVTWTGPSGDAVRTMAHGLGGTPELLIYKNRDEDFNWYVGTSAITFNFNTDYLQLNTNIAKATDAGGTVFNSAPTSTVIGGANSSASAKENIKYVAYCFRSIQGYSKIGAYTGNGNADGPFVYTGFKPAFFIVKRTDASGENFVLRDNAVSPINPVNAYLVSNDNRAEANHYAVDLLSNGFKVRTSESGHNHDGGTYIYIAFAESPFVSSEGVPTTAR